jgi:hypothetical protein
MKFVARVISRWRIQTFVFFIAFVLTTLSAVQVTRAEDAQPATSPVEELYVLRSVRESRAQPSDTCAASRSKLQEPAWEDQYTFRSIATNADDGRVLNTNVKSVGSIRACFGKTKDPEVLELYGEVSVNGIAAKAFGKCNTAKRDFPEKGVNLFACLFELFDLPPEYVGGQLTTNSLSSSELFGTESKPAGYTQVSIATIRLWKKR